MRLPFIRFLILIFLGISPSTVQAMSCSDSIQSATIPRWREVDKSETLSQFLRANGRHYWTWSANHAAEYLSDYLRFQGWVMGDPHPGNFGVIAVNRKMRWLNVDFDDGGQGPFVLDLARLILTVKSVSDEIKIKELIAAYLSGLKNESWPFPKKIQGLLNLSATDIRELEDEYADKKSKDDQFKYKKNRLRPIRNKQALIGQITPLLKGYKILDLGQRINDRGGSSQSLRYWALIEKAGYKHVIEFKELAEPATSGYKSQPSHDRRLKGLADIFWKSNDRQDNLYGLVKLQNKSFWMRPKKLDLLDIPYNISDQAEMTYFSELALLVAHTLGQAHGHQSTGQKWRAFMTKNKDNFRHDLKEFIHAYSDIAVARWGND